ncbi:MAG: hypothetical protein IKA59_02335 [Clostridia bacterium]|nr:hypothetical protein [Clostridia bacterium]
MKDQDEKFIKEFLNRADVKELVWEGDLAGVYKLYIGMLTKYLKTVSEVDPLDYIKINDVYSIIDEMKNI